MATATKLGGPTAVGPGLKVASYSVLMDSSYPTGGEAIDFSADFTNIYGISFGGNDTSADNTYVFAALLPAPATTVSSSNTLIQVFLGGTTDAVMEEEGNTTDLSTIGTLRCFVWGI